MTSLSSSDKERDWTFGCRKASVAHDDFRVAGQTDTHTRQREARQLNAGEQVTCFICTFAAALGPMKKCRRVASRLEGHASREQGRPGMRGHADDGRVTRGIRDAGERKTLAYPHFYATCIHRRSHTHACETLLTASKEDERKDLLEDRLARQSLATFADMMSRVRDALVTLLFQVRTRVRWRGLWCA